mmetsp:Transcript_14094/g.23050  ORF Transcript_14094/g.23050 Transcript_14094/m.23050 type:complete len:84 (-) Transcript_14094:367-618(-)
MTSLPLITPQHHPTRIGFTQRSFQGSCASQRIHLTAGKCPMKHWKNVAQLTSSGIMRVAAKLKEWVDANLSCHDSRNRDTKLQ